jgi:hypothetical protein
VITLSFRPLQSGSAVLVRAAHFRICADGTLRGPDNTTAARFLEGLWYLGQRRHTSFECTGPIYLRVTQKNGRRECIGPYAALRASDGAIFDQNSCLGRHVMRAPETGIIELWREVSFVTSV